MDQNQQIIELLKRAKQKGLKFAQVRADLLAQGYSEESISQAADQFPYDESLREQDVNQVEEYFDKHPDQAVVDGQNVLKAKEADDAKDARERAALDITAAAVSPRFDNSPSEPQLNFLNRFAFDVNVPVSVLLIALILVNVVSYFIVKWLKISHLYYAVNGLLTLILVAWLIKRIR